MDSRKAFGLMMDGLADRLTDVLGRIERACDRCGRPVSSVRLIAVTKNHPLETVQRLLDLGVRDIGENRVQEMEAKLPRLSGEFTAHLIGHLQTNKAQKAWPLAGWIQSVDREKLVRCLDGCHAAGEPKKPVLVEVNTSGEGSKSGCQPDDCGHLCDLVTQSSALELRGLMTIGPLGGDERAVRSAFVLLRELSQKYCTGINAPELSMGMSGDFEWAIEEGATMVRIGTILLGDRGY